MSLAEFWEAAACRQTDPELWFDPEGREGGKARRLRVLTAKAICRSCPLIEACGRDAIETDKELGYFGIRAALTAEERKVRTTGPVAYSRSAAETRARIVLLNGNGDSLTDIAATLELNVSTVRDHLRTAKAEGAVDGKAPPSHDTRCGTSAGYKAHYRRNEMACAECKASHAWHRANTKSAS